MNYLFIASVSYVFIFAKSYQQLNVVFKKYKWVPIMSLIMAACEVFVITAVVKDSSWFTVLALGSGAALGCMTSMAIHEQLTGKGWGDK